MEGNRRLEDRKKEAVRATLFPLLLLVTKHLNCEQKDSELLRERLEHSEALALKTAAEH